MKISPFILSVFILLMLCACARKPEGLSEAYLLDHGFKMWDQMPLLYKGVEDTSILIALDSNKMVEQKSISIWTNNVDSALQAIFANPAFVPLVGKDSLGYDYIYCKRSMILYRVINGKNHVELSQKDGRFTDSYAL